MYLTIEAYLRLEINHYCWYNDHWYHHCPSHDQQLLESNCSSTFSTNLGSITTLITTLDVVIIINNLITFIIIITDGILHTDYIVYRLLRLLSL